MHRKLIKNYVEILLLNEILRHRNIHGYGLISLIEKRLGFKPSPSMIYPLLRRLKERGLIESCEKLVGSKKVVVYKITKRGREYLENNMDLLLKAREYEKKLLLAKDIGLLSLANTLRELMNVIDKLDEEKLKQLSFVIEEFSNRIRRIMGG